VASQRSRSRSPTPSPSALPFVADFDADHRCRRGDRRPRLFEPVCRALLEWQGPRPILGPQRSIGSVIKLLTPSPEFSAEHNAFLESIPPHVLELVYVIKEAYRPEWGADWRSHFTVSRVNGRPGNRLRLDGQQVLVDMLRVGFESDGSYRLFSLRPDFAPALKVQTEDDITASVVVAASDAAAESVKVVENCEGLLFQRPDDAIHPGYDSIAETMSPSRERSCPTSSRSIGTPPGRCVMTRSALSEFTSPMRRPDHRLRGGHRR
jgi:hypothetical protein